MSVIAFGPSLRTVNGTVVQAKTRALANQLRPNVLRYLSEGYLLLATSPPTIGKPDSSDTIIVDLTEEQYLEKRRQSEQNERKLAEMREQLARLHREQAKAPPPKAPLRQRPPKKANGKPTPPEPCGRPPKTRKRPKASAEPIKLPSEANHSEPVADAESSIQPVPSEQIAEPPLENPEAKASSPPVAEDMIESVNPSIEPIPGEVPIEPIDDTAERKAKPKPQSEIDAEFGTNCKRRIPPKPEEEEEEQKEDDLPLIQASVDIAESLVASTEGLGLGAHDEEEDIPGFDDQEFVAKKIPIIATGFSDSDDEMALLDPDSPMKPEPQQRPRKPFANRASVDCELETIRALHVSVVDESGMPDENSDSFDGLSSINPVIKLDANLSSDDLSPDDLDPRSNKK
jgi:hypothetical protein